MSTVLNTEFLTANQGNTLMVAAPFSVPTPTTAQSIANKQYVDYASYGTYRSVAGVLNFGVAGSAFANSDGFPVMYQITGMGNHITLQIAPVPRTSATTTSIFAKGGVIPADYRPVQTVTVPCMIYVDVYGSTIGELSVDSAGYVYITCPLLNGQYPTFTSGILAGFPGLNITYLQV